MAKFNQWGQWTLEKSDTQLIKGIKPAGPPASNRSDVTEGLKGADVVKMAAIAIANGGLPDQPGVPKAAPQPTNEQMFGHLVVSQEQLKKAEEDWNNTFNKHLNGLNQKIDHLNKSKIEGSWGYGKSFNSLLSEKERNERNAYIGNTKDTD